MSEKALRNVFLIGTVGFLIVLGFMAADAITPASRHDWIKITKEETV